MRKNPKRILVICAMCGCHVVFDPIRFELQSITSGLPVIRARWVASTLLSRIAGRTVLLVRGPTAGPEKLRYSYRSATIGSTLVARRAGT